MVCEAGSGYLSHSIHAASESFRGPLMGYDAFEEVEKAWRK